MKGGEKGESRVGKRGGSMMGKRGRSRVGKKGEGQGWENRGILTVRKGEELIVGKRWWINGGENGEGWEKGNG